MKCKQWINRLFSVLIYCQKYKKLKNERTHTCASFDTDGKHKTRRTKGTTEQVRAGLLTTDVNCVNIDLICLNEHSTKKASTLKNDRLYEAYVY